MEIRLYILHIYLLEKLAFDLVGIDVQGCLEIKTKNL